MYTYLNRITFFKPSLLVFFLLTTGLSVTCHQYRSVKNRNSLQASFFKEAEQGKKNKPKKRKYNSATLKTWALLLVMPVFVVLVVLVFLISNKTSYSQTKQKSGSTKLLKGNNGRDDKGNILTETNKKTQKETSTQGEEEEETECFICFEDYSTDKITKSKVVKIPCCKGKLVHIACLQEFYSVEDLKYCSHCKAHHSANQKKMLKEAIKNKVSKGEGSFFEDSQN